MNRCEAHGLATAPDGLCTLCRRRAQQASSRRFGGLIAVTLACAVAIAVLFVAGRAVLDAARAATAQTTAADTTTGASTAQIKVYTTKWCPACRATRRWLDEHKITYEERDVESDPAAAAAFRKLGGRSVPMFDIDGQVKAGFDPVWVTRAIEKSEARRAER